MNQQSGKRGLAICVLAALTYGMVSEVTAQVTVLPEGEAMWNLEGSARETTPTRQYISMEGLWRWQPAGDDLDSVPTDGWGYVQAPSPWPGGGGRRGGGGGRQFYPNPAWDASQLRDVTAAWYQVEMEVPAEWAGRRVALTTEFLHSFATVYVDGQKVADMRFPAGEVDLTPVCRPGEKHVLSMLVLALPLRSVMMSYNDSDAAREIRGRVGRRGLCGDVRLVGTPQGARIRHMRVETSVRNWQITFNTALEDVQPEAAYALRAVVKDGGETVEEFTSKPFRGSDVSNGRIAVTDDWHPDKLWDIHTPENQYDVTVSLLDANGNLLDQALPERFGFREFWVDGRDFYLNGTRVFLSFTRSGPGSSYEGARETLEERKRIGINFVACGGFGAEPGSHMSFEGALRAADDVGTLIALTQPHINAYEWDAPDADETNGYAEHAEFYTRVAGNHPSVVFYAANHNSCGYAEDMNPDLIDGLVDRSAWSRGPNMGHALRAEALVKRFDPTRVLYHHAGGNLGSMHTSNFYANWTPIQEMSDWFEHWATVGVKPVHPNEYSVPFPWDWAMYFGWYKGVREFGSAVVPWEFCLAEWNAQFYGDSAYRISEEEKENLRWEAEKFRNGELWQRWDYPHRLSGTHPEREGVYSMYFTDNWRAFRTWGVSVNTPDIFARHLPVEVLARDNGPLLAYIGGKPGAFTSKDHNFLPGETFQKQLIVINNSRETIRCDCEWSFALPSPVTGAKSIGLPTGEQARIPLAFELPAGLTPGQYTLSATVRYSNGETQDDSFTVDVLPEPDPVRTSQRIAVFDPKGETSSLLSSLGVAFDRIGETNANLGAYDVFIIGKGALTLDGAAPDISRVRDGLKVVIFEQRGQVLEKRFGFRTAEYGLRWVFKRVSDHPLLAGITDEDLYNWRGDATILPPRLAYELDYSPTVEWCGMRVKRGWRCGSRGNVASALIEKPAAGDFLPILDGGYALQYASLMEYREGAGMVLFCQTDVTGRTETDPAAEALARNTIQYAADWEPSPRRAAVYVGDALGREQLEAAGLALAPYEGGELSADQALIVGKGGGRELAGDAPAIADWLRAGGHVLALGLDGDEASSFLPFEVTTNAQEHIATYFQPAQAGTPLAGVAPADVHNRAPRELPLVTGGAVPVGGGVLARADGLNVVFCQLTPQAISPTLGLPTAFSAVADDEGGPGALVSLGPVTPGGASLGQWVEDAVAGRRYTLAVFAKAIGGDANAHLGAELTPRPRWGVRYSPGESVGRGDEVRIPADEWTELHIRFAVDDPADLRAYLGCSQPGARLRLKAFRLYEDDYAPAFDPADGNLLRNGDFAAGEGLWRFEFAQQRNVKRTYRRASCLVTRLLANMGVAGRTQLLEHVSQPVAQGEQRWLDGLYLDVPEEWDDPYRFFRW